MLRSSVRLGSTVFRPLPLLGNPHVQTVLGSLLPGALPRFPCSLREVVLADGDRLVVHDTIPAGWHAGAGVVLLVHGLGGCYRSGYMRRLTAALWRAGLRVLRLDLRGVGAGEALARRTYHGGCSTDVRAVAVALHQEFPTAPLVLVGASLGGNIVLKLAGEAAGHPVSGLVGVAALAPPIDLCRCAVLLAYRRNRIYEGYFVRNLVRQVRRHQRHFPDLPRTRFPRCLSMRMFDDLYTAPGWGFADAMDYYRRASALPYLHQIRVPAFILTARDDPFIAVEPFEGLRLGPAAEVHIVNHGGHLGFLGHDGAGGIRWAERQVINWVRRLLA
jgi:predicted alpha/beta-fold hydrolase